MNTREHRARAVLSVGMMVPATLGRWHRPVSFKCGLTSANESSSATLSLAFVVRGRGLHRQHRPRRQPDDAFSDAAHDMVRNLGGEKRLQSRIGLLTEIDDHVLCDLGRHRQSALWTHGVQEHEGEVSIPQMLIHGVRRRLAWNDV